MREVTITRTLAAAPDAVWRVLADYSGIDRWNRNVKASRATNGLETGLGAQRHCEMSPAGSLTESIAEWEPGSLLVVRIDSTKMIPIKTALVDYRLAPGEDNRSTAMQVRYRFEPKWGPVGRLLAPMVARRLAHSFEDVLTDLELAANDQRR